MSACICWTKTLLHSGHCCLRDVVEASDGGLLMTCGHEIAAVALLERTAA